MRNIKYLCWYYESNKSASRYNLVQFLPLKVEVWGWKCRTSWGLARKFRKYSNHHIVQSAKLFLSFENFSLSGHTTYLLAQVFYNHLKKIEIIVVIFLRKIKYSTILKYSKSYFYYFPSISRSINYRNGLNLEDITVTKQIRHRFCHMQPAGTCHAQWLKNCEQGVFIFFTTLVARYVPKIDCNNAHQRCVLEVRKYHS